MFLKNKIKFSILVFMMLTALKLPAAEQCHQQRRCFTPLQVSLFNKAQTSPDYCDVNGIRANLIYGKNKNVSGIDVGIVNHATGNLNGYEVGIINNVEGDVNGVQRGIYNHGRNVRGFQDGWVNVCEGRFTGVQSSLIYGGACDMCGLQVSGIVSNAKRVRGVQVGLINFTNHLKGAQIGLINIQKSKSRFRVLPILNISNYKTKPKYRSCNPQACNSSRGYRR